MNCIRTLGAPLLLGALLSNGASAQQAPGSVEFFINDAGDYDYGLQTEIPAEFGSGEFTLELWIRPNDSYPVGPVGSGAAQRTNWSDVDNPPYSSDTWWFAGNFLLDGHNNNGSANGTFSLQFYGGGRVRWLFGDGASPGPGGNRSVGAYPADTTPSLLDGDWHQVTLVRRWADTSSATLELWIDGNLVATEATPVRTDMRQWWDGWSGFPAGQQGWFWGAEKQAAIGALSQYEDYKGLIDELRFWSRARTAAEISASYMDPVANDAPGLVGKFVFGEGQGDAACDTLNPPDCISLVNTGANAWSAQNAPLSGTDTLPPSVPGNLQGSAVSDSRIDLDWNAASDDVGVTGYDVLRDGTVVAGTTETSYSDTGLAPGTSYVYTVRARDAAGNMSGESASVTVTTLDGPDDTPPSTPTGLAGNAVSPSRIDLTWSASTDNVAVTGYDIRRDGTVVGTTTQTRFSDTGLDPGTRYEYTVAARDGSDNLSAQSTAISVVTDTDDDPPPDDPGSSGGGSFGVPFLLALLLIRKRR